MGGTITQKELDKLQHGQKVFANIPQMSTIPSLKDEKVSHGSGATSSHFSPYSFYNPFEGSKLTCLRFAEGNRKHEFDDPVYANANWLKAFHERDVKFFRDRAGHALEHLIAEMRGQDDHDPGGNLGALGWFQEVMAFVKANDPFLYGSIQGKWNVNDKGMEETFNQMNNQGCEQYGVSNQT